MNPRWKTGAMKDRPRVICDIANPLRQVQNRAIQSRFCFQTSKKAPPAVDSVDSSG